MIGMAANRSDACNKRELPVGPVSGCVEPYPAVDSPWYDGRSSHEFALLPFDLAA
jgi:hypothetical protein